MSPSLLGIGLALVFCTPAQAGPLTADDVVRYALEHHPTAVAAAGASGAAEGARHAAGWFLTNPVAEGSFAVVGDLVHAEVTQPLSLTGEGWSARKSLGAGADAAEARLRRVRAEVAAQARAAYVRSAAAAARVRIADDALAQATRLRASVDDRAVHGDVSALEAGLARLAEARAVAESVQARREVAAATAGLAAWHPEAATAELSDLIEAAVPVGLGAAGRSDLEAADHAVVAARAGLSRARAGVVPAVGVGVSFEAEGDDLDVGPVVAVELPLWSRNQGVVAEARSALATAEAERDTLRAVVDAERSSTASVSTFAAEAAGRLEAVDADARAAFGQIDLAVGSGDLSMTAAALLRADIVDAWTAVIDGREAAALARLDALLAVEDDALWPIGSGGEP